MWANAHETRDSISLISYADCLGLSPVTSAKIHSKCASQPAIAKNSLITRIFGVHGHSRSSMLVPPESSSAVLVMTGSKSVSICNRSLIRLGDNSRNRTLWRGYPNLVHSYGLFQPRGSKLTPLNLHRCNLRLMLNRLSWSISNGIGTTNSWNVYRILKSRKID